MMPLIPLQPNNYGSDWAGHEGKPSILVPSYVGYVLVARTMMQFGSIGRYREADGVRLLLRSSVSLETDRSPTNCTKNKTLFPAYRTVIEARRRTLRERTQRPHLFPAFFTHSTQNQFCTDPRHWPVTTSILGRWIAFQGFSLWSGTETLRDSSACAPAVLPSHCTRFSTTCDKGYIP